MWKEMTGSKVPAGTRVQLDKHWLGLRSADTDQALGAAKEKEQGEPPQAGERNPTCPAQPLTSLPTAWLSIDLELARLG